MEKRMQLTSFVVLIRILGDINHQFPLPRVWKKLSDFLGLSFLTCSGREAGVGVKDL